MKKIVSTESTFSEGERDEVLEFIAFVIKQNGEKGLSIDEKFLREQNLVFKSKKEKEREKKYSDDLLEYDRRKKELKEFGEKLGVQEPYKSQYNNYQSRPKETEPTNSFKYNSKTQFDQLDSILSLLKRNGFVKEVKLPVFKKIFNDTPLNKINPVDWQISIASLRYFIKNFNFEMSNINKYKIAAICFTYSGKRLTFIQIRNAKTGNIKAIANISSRYPFIK